MRLLILVAVMTSLSEAVGACVVGHEPNQEWAEFDPSQPRLDRIDSESVNDAFKEVFTDPAYRRLLPKDETLESEFFLFRWIRRFQEWLGSFFDQDGAASPRGGGGGGRGGRGSGGMPGSAGSASGLGGIAKLLTYGIVTVLIAGAIALIVRAIMIQRGRARGEIGLDMLSTDEAISPTVPPGEIPCDEYERRARELAASGDFKGAVRQLVLGSMSWIEREGLIRYRKGLTNRDYLRSLYRDSRRRGAMSEIVRVFELVYYGRRIADPSKYDCCLSEYRGAFRAQKEAVAN